MHLTKLYKRVESCNESCSYVVSTHFCVAHGWSKIHPSATSFLTTATLFRLRLRAFTLLASTFTFLLFSICRGKHWCLEFFINPSCCNNEFTRLWLKCAVITLSSHVQVLYISRIEHKIWLWIHLSIEQFSLIAMQVCYGLGQLRFSGFSFDSRKVGLEQKNIFFFFILP